MWRALIGEKATESRGRKLSRRISKTRIDIINLAQPYWFCLGSAQAAYDYFLIFQANQGSVKLIHDPLLKQKKISRCTTLSLCLERLLIFQILSITID